MSDIEKGDLYGRLDVTIPEGTYIAGKVSTVRILIRNPFDKPVEIVEIRGPRSSFLCEISEEPTYSGNSQPGVQPAQKTGRGVIRSFFEKLSRVNVQISEISFSGISAEFPRTRKSFNIRAEPNSEIEVDIDLSDYESVNVSAEEGAKVKFNPQTKPSTHTDKTAITIEPHCEAVAYFQISTAGWLFFTPTRQSLSTQVTYRLEGKEKTHVTTSDFDIRPPLTSMVIGSIVGAVLGTLAKILNSSQPLAWQPSAVSIGASTLMSLISTIALSRKTGAQGFITVEDFFGGFVVGALIGYGGSQYFEKALIPSKPAS